MSKSRIASIETFRVIAIFFVICIHANLFFSFIDTSPYYKLLYYGIKNLSRFAVPFFFIVAGYFFAKQINKNKLVHKLLLTYLKRLFIIFFSWSVIYGLIPSNIPLKTIIASGLNYDFITLLKSAPLAALNKLQTQPIDFFWQGTMWPLWFLMGLMIGLIILIFFILIKKDKYIIPFAAILYLFNLLIDRNAYLYTPIGIHLPFFVVQIVSPLFFSLFFIAVGWWFSKQKKLPSMQLALIFLVGGFAFQEIENFLLGYYFKPTYRFMGLAGTVPFAAGVFLLCMARPNIGKNTFLPKIATLTLGIYVSHMLIIPYVRAFPLLFENFPINEIIWQILFPVLVFIFSALFVYFLRKFRITRFLVS